MEIPLIQPLRPWIQKIELKNLFIAKIRPSFTEFAV